MHDDEQKEYLEEPLRLFRKKIIPKLPSNIQKRVIGEVERLEELFVDSRPPRFAIIGRRGAGKSTLVNAIFQAPVAEVGAVTAETERGAWHTYKNTSQKAVMEVLDTRGFGEGDETRFTQTEEDVWQEALSSRYPDAILFLVKAKEVDARVTEDIEQLKKLREIIKKKHDYLPPVIGIVTQVDELDPVYDTDPPFDEEKVANIEHASDHMEHMLKKHLPEVTGILPVCAYTAFKNGEMVYDRRWNIDELIDFLLEQLPGSTWMQWARITQAKTIQIRIAKTIGKSASAITGGVGAQPIPLADLPVITGIQMSMIAGIAYVSGRKLDRKSMAEFLGAIGANVGTAFAFRQLARSLSKVTFPVAGHAISGTLAATATWGLCKAAILYFIEKRPVHEAKEAYKNQSEPPTD
ncbi:50S ribosome-binding GTPase [Salicibibacter cibarius]|uniref:50S ribosome-binding GTPase n=1 Tax=Salicibibacter cibarius TaxID=2743000 RepID=A0A7T6Z258_9BACI|nr:GTPase [Salicibibacter cibarius]QQK75580.1 50S ribosome-binding GTPase [Salicibibacter cibarius]